jgi:2,3-diaminopropionate biosynthesis protein SbnB
MTDSSILLVAGSVVDEVCDGQYEMITEVIHTAYRAHAYGQDFLPQASILRFPDRLRDRIIALPAHINGAESATGVKWISSFPANTEIGAERASAVILLNSMSDGRVSAIMEGSVISAKRTAASAALAASLVHRRTPATLGLIGCGRINYEIMRFLLAVGPAIDSVVIYDLDPQRAENFGRLCGESMPDGKVGYARSVQEVLASCSLISFATTAVSPYVDDLSMCLPGATILHISLRDIAAQAILTADNLVDDIDHVCSAQTSVHLAEQFVGHRDFIRGTLGEVILGKADPREDDTRPLVFSPFGLGTLDIALASALLELARSEGLALPDFWPVPWSSVTRPMRSDS